MKRGFTLYFAILALVNLLILLEANQDAFSQSVSPYDFYVLLWGGSKVFMDPSQLYVWQSQSTVGPLWAGWLRDGANFAYTPMFAAFLSPFSGIYPPAAKLAWELLSYSVLVLACAFAVNRVRWRFAKLSLPVLVFAMPIPIVFTNQILPLYWGHPFEVGMLISPAYYAEYYHGNVNTMVLALALLSLSFGARDYEVGFGRFRVPSYALSAVFFALDTFKITAVVLILPFWLVLNRRNLLKSIILFLGLVGILNSVAILEPVLISGYWSKLTVEESFPTSLSPLWQAYEYVWYYTIPIFGLILLLSRRRVQGRDKEKPGGSGGSLMITRSRT